MSQTLARVQSLISAGKVRISDHAYDELIEDGLFGSELIAGVDRALVVEDYPYYAKGPCVLVLQRDAGGSPIHALWGFPPAPPSPLF